MPNNKKLDQNLADYFDLPNPGLRAYFEHVRMGQPEEYRTPFYKGKTPQSIVAGWLPKLSTIKDSWPSLWDWENDLAAKVGPMSIMKPLAERMKDIDHYYTDITGKSEPISTLALDDVCNEWRSTGHLRIRGQDRTVETMKKSTNSGSPYFTKRKLVTRKTTPCFVEHTLSDVYQHLNLSSDGSGDKWKACAVLGWRGQEGGPNPEDVKQRVVWMFPYAVNIRELQVYQPLVEVAQHFNIVPSWVGMDSVDKRVTDMFDTKRKYDLVVCTDFTKFDQHFNSHLQTAARDIIEYIFDGAAGISEWLDDVFPVKYMIPLMYDYGKFLFGPHGMGSGSGGTNADETLVHRALQYEAARRIRSKLNPASQCLGDDGVLTYPGISVEQVVESYSAHGLEMNTSKQYASKHDCVYLRRWHHEDYRHEGVCVGVYSTCRALGRLAEQERYYDPEVWGAEMVALRQLSIIENVKYHPLREEFLDYCIKGDKYRLGLDIPGFIDNIARYAQEATDMMPDFLGYTRSLSETDPSRGINSWWVIHALRDRR